MIFKFILNFKFIFAVRTNDESGKCIYKTYSVPKSEHLVSKQNVGKFILKRLKKLQVIRIKKKITNLKNTLCRQYFTGQRIILELNFNELLIMNFENLQVFFYINIECAGQI